MLALLLVAVLPQFFASFVLAQDPVIDEALSLTVFSDGFVQAVHELVVNQSFPTANVTLLGQTRENLLVVDENGLPLGYGLLDSKAVVESLGAGQIRASYYTSDLTLKTGGLWTLKTTVSVKPKIVLPVNASVISLNCVPELIETSNDQMNLVMPCGLIEITYLTERSSPQQVDSSQNLPLSEIAIALLFILFTASVLLWLFLTRRKKLGKTETKKTVDLDKLLAKHKDLREEEIFVVRLLADRNGSAFEAELYENLNLPRTTTWRLIKRLEKKEILDVRKSRRQNIVSIRNKYKK